MGKAHDIAGKVTGMAKAAGAVAKGELGIFKRLKMEHGEVSTLLERLSASTDPELRRELLPKVRKELLSHAEGEEREFYSVLRDNPKTRGIVERSFEEHDEVEKLLNRLESLGVEDEQWSETFDELRRSVEKHVEEEENDLFPRAMEVLDKEQADRIEERYKTKKEQVMQQLGA